MRPYSPGGALNALTSSQQGSTPAATSAHRLRRGLPGYLILFATHAFAPQCQYRSREPPSPPVFLPVSTHFTAPLGILLPPPGLKLGSFKGSSPVEPRAFTLTYLATYVRFTPSNSEQRLPPPYYRGCWHGVSRGFLWWYSQNSQGINLVSFFPPDRSLQSENLHPPRGVAGSGFPPLPKIPHCCLP